jgi:hypothetical protein
MEELVFVSLIDIVDAYQYRDMWLVALLIIDVREVFDVFVEVYSNGFMHSPGS